MINRLPKLLMSLGMGLLSLTAHGNEAPDYDGAQLYRVFCASCHGQQARGQGPAAHSMKRRPPDLTRIAQRHDGVFPVEMVTAIIDGRDRRAAHGAPGMPVWGQEFYGMDGEDPVRRQRSQELIARLVTYLHSIQR